MNPVFRVVLQQAQKMIKNPTKTRKTLERAMKKSGKVAADGKKGNFLIQLKDDLALFFAMMGDFLRGRYRKLPMSTAVKILGALLYFVLLVDFIPDFLTVIGLTDDAAVLAWVIKSIGGDIDKYREWKATQNNDDPLEAGETIELS